MGDANAEVLQLKAILAGKIIEVLDEQKISVRRAHELTGFAAADFSRVRQAKLQRFTVDRLMQMLAKLNQDVEVSISIRPRLRQRHRLNEIAEGLGACVMNTKGDPDCARVRLARGLQAASTGVPRES